MRRKRMNKRKSKKLFARTSRSHGRNRVSGSPRGGIRL